MKTRITSLLLCCTFLCASAQDTWTDTRDNQIYKIVTLGDQTWLAQNFNFENEGSFCYDDEQENCDKYGRL